MKLSDLTKNKIIIRVSLLLPIVIAIVAVILKIQYYICDDDYMNWISNGTLTGKADEHLLFINVCLGYLFKWLNLISSNINWYGWFFIFLIVISVYALIFTLKKYVNVYIALFISLIVELYLLFNYSFTGLATIVTSIGIIKVIESLNNNFKGKRHFVFLVFSVLLLECGLMTRRDSFLASVVIAIPLIIFSVFNNKKILFRFCATIFIVVILSSGLLLIDSKSYSSKEWKEWKKFSSTRSELTDYVIADYDKNISNYKKIGISKNDYECIRNRKMVNGCFSDKKFFNIKRLKQIIKMTQNKERYDFELLDYFKQIGSIRIIWVFILLELLFYISIKNRTKWFYIAQIAVTLLTLSCLVFLRRMPERVYNPLVLSSILISIYQFLKSKQEIKNILRYGLLICGVLITLWTFKLVGQNVKQYNTDEQKATKYSELISYIDNNDNKLFVFDQNQFSTIFYGKPIINTGIKQVKNAMPLLDVYTYAPFYYDCINKFHLFDRERLNLAFVENDNVYYVDFSDNYDSHHKKDILIRYIKEHTHKKIKVKTIKTIKKCKASVLKIEYQ